jgi:hypothetical protein
MLYHVLLLSAFLIAVVTIFLFELYTVWSDTLNVET